VTSRKAARIRDRLREPGAPPSERDPDVEPRSSSRPQRPPATSLARFRAPGAPPSPSAARSGDPHTDFEARSRHPSARERGRSPRPHPGRPPVGELLRSGIHTLMSSPRREPLRRRAGPGRPAHGNVRDLGRRAPPRGDDERDAVVPTSPLTSFTGSFTRNACTRAESRTGPPSAPPKGWPTSLSSTPRGAGSSAGRSPRR